MAEAMEHELQVYKALHHIQGSIPRLYACAYVYSCYSGRSILALVLETADKNSLTSLDISTSTDDEKIAISNIMYAF